MEKLVDLDLSVFDPQFDSHRRARQYLRTIKAIQENRSARFHQFLENLPLKKTPARFEWIQLPKKPRPQLEQALPSQADVKKLIETVFVDGKRYSIRDQAILALLKDTGCRIGEALNIRNGHIREEGNYLVVSFPESKSMPRTVISFLAKPYLEAWAKVSPNKSKGPDAFFFCQSNDSSCSYAAVIKEL